VKAVDRLLAAGKTGAVKGSGRAAIPVRGQNPCIIQSPTSYIPEHPRPFQLALCNGVLAVSWLMQDLDFAILLMI
jgi:hypothetical protein